MNNELIIPIIVFLVVAGLAVSALLLTMYGVYLSFSKKWYIGAVALALPIFGFTVGIAKFIFKKDLLK